MSEEKVNMEALTLELKRGTQVLGVLSQLKTPMYGYSLVEKLAGKGMEIDKNTLYPLLRRLEKQGLIAPILKIRFTEVHHTHPLFLPAHSGAFARRFI